MATLAPGLSTNKKKRVDPNLQKLSLRFQKAQQAYASESAKTLQDYQANLDVYNTNLANFESRANAYQQRVDAYNAALDAWNTKGERFGLEVAYNPVQNNFAIQEYLRTGRNAQQYNQMMRQFGITPSSDRPYEIGFTEAQNPNFFYELGDNNRGYLYKRGGPDPGVFSEQFTDVAPEAPAAVDLSAAQAKLAQEEQYYKREVGERQLGRIRARRRVAERPLLGGESA